MNGNTLALGLVGALAAAGVAAQRGSAAVQSSGPLDASKRKDLWWVRTFSPVEVKTCAPGNEKALQVRFRRFMGIPWGGAERDLPVKSLGVETVSYTHLTLPTIYSV